MPSRCRSSSASATAAPRRAISSGAMGTRPIQSFSLTPSIYSMTRYGVVSSSRNALGQAGRSNLLCGQAVIVGNPIEREPRTVQIGERVACLVVVVARLAGGADDGEPSTVRPGGDGRPGHRPEGHRSATGADVVQLLFMHVPAEDVSGVPNLHAVFRLAQARDIDPLLRRRRAGVHE